MISRVSKLFTQYPITKGMCVYAVIWPTSSMVQQVIAGNKEIDWKKNLRFFLFGTFFVAPTLYGWIKLSSMMWPQMNLRSGIAKAITEQFSYGPFAGVSFFTLMTLMEGRGFEEAKKEVCEKFPQTFKIGVCYWPFVQIINFSFIKEQNRVPFVAMASFVWTIFLAYVKQLETQDDQLITQSDNTTLSTNPKQLNILDGLWSKVKIRNYD